MNNQFDELTKSLAQSVTRRAALTKFGLGLAGMALACFGLANKAEAGGRSGYCMVTVTADQSYLSGFCGDCKGNALPSPDCPYGTPASSNKVCFNSGGFPVYLSSIRCHQ